MKKLIAAVCAAASLPTAGAAYADDPGDYYSYTDEGNSGAYLNRPLPSAWTNSYAVPSYNSYNAPAYNGYAAPRYDGGYTYPAYNTTYPAYGYPYPTYDNSDEVYASWVRYWAVCRRHAQVHQTLSAEKHAYDDAGYYNFYQRELTHEAIREQHARYHYYHPAADSCMSYPQYQTYWYGGGYRY